MKTFGSRAEVMHGTAKKTSGGLVKGDLKYNKWGSIVSRRKSVLANKQKHLAKAGWTAKKGKFGAVCMKKSCKKTAKKMGRKGKGHKGGSGLDSMLKGFMGGEEVKAPTNAPTGEETNASTNAPTGEETKANGANGAPTQNGGAKKGKGKKGHGRK